MKKQIEKIPTVVRNLHSKTMNSKRVWLMEILTDKEHQNEN